MAIVVRKPHVQKEFAFLMEHSCVPYSEIRRQIRNLVAEIEWQVVHGDWSKSIAFPFGFLQPLIVAGENGEREDTSCTAPISIDLPPFRPVRSYDGQIFRPATGHPFRRTNSKLISVTRPFLGSRGVVALVAILGWRPRATCHRETPGSTEAHPDLSVTIEPWEPEPWAAR